MTASKIRRTGLPCTVLFVDVCGSTALYNKLGNTRAQAVIAKTIAVLSQAARRHVGVIVKTIGDEVMCTFASPSDAAAAAVDMQRSVQQAIAIGDIEVKTLEVKVGFHSGPVISDAADVFGDSVNVAARVIAYAKAGQILVPKQTLRLLPKVSAVGVRPVGSTGVKGKQGLVELYELIWNYNGITKPVNIASMKPGNMRATAKFGPVAIEVDFNRPVIRLGRGAENDLDVPDKLASRLHAKLEYRRDRVMLVDQSLNGTYVQMQGKSEVVLRREEIALEGTGLIRLGKSIAGQRELCVRFTVQKGGPKRSRS